MSTKLKERKIVLLGAGAVGKSCLVLRLSGKSLPTEYIPTVVDQVDVTYGLHLFKVVEAGGRGIDEYKKFRTLYYNDADLVGLCFALNNKKSFEAVKEDYLPHVQENCNVQVLLIGCKCDLKSDEKHRDNLVDTKEVYDYVNSIKGCVGFVETSALTGDGLEDLKKAFETFGETRAARKRNQQALCTIL